MKLAISTFTHREDRWPKQKTTRWELLLKALTRFRFANDKTGVPLWCPATFKQGSARGKANVEQVSCLVWDYDDGTTVEDALIPWADYHLAWHTSFSHTSEHPKFRVVIPLQEPIDAQHWPKVWTAYSKIATPPDPACKDASRMYYVPSAPNGSESWDCGSNPHAQGFLKADPHIWDRPEPAKAHFPRTPYHAQWKMRDKYNESRGARVELAKSLNARTSENRAFGIECPKCKKKTVHFYLDPDGGQKTARCNHFDSCGFWSWLGDLA